MNEKFINSISLENREFGEAQLNILKKLIDEGIDV